MKITFVLPSYIPEPVGGYRVVYEHADRLSAYGHEVTIVYPRRTPASDRPPGLERQVKDSLWPWAVRLRNRPLVGWHRLHPSVRLKLVATLGDDTLDDADVVVATGWQTAEPVMRLSPRKGRKFYLIQHYEVWSGPQEAVDATWRLPLRKIVISRWLEDLGRRLDPGGRVDYVTNGIDLDRFRVLNPPETRPMSVLSLFHTAPFKGVPDALEALGRFHARHPSVPVSLFGAEPPPQPLPDWIGFTLKPPQETLVRDLYNGHAVYLSASVTEGWGLPPAEAMACGCAFVGTDIDGFREFARNDETALLTPARDPEGLFRNLCRMAEEPDLRRRIQAAGTAHINSFTWERAGRALEAILASP